MNTIPKFTWSKINTIESPPERGEAASVVYEDKLYIHGGTATKDLKPRIPKNFDVLDDFWYYDFITETFHQVENVSEEKPSARHGHTLVISEEEKAIYLFGGRDDFDHLFNDLWKYELNSKRWIEILQCNDCRPSPCSHFVSFLHDSKLFIFGGLSATNRGGYTDMYSFDFKNQKWEKIQMKGTIPSPRSWCAWVKYENSLYLHGGLDYDDFRNKSDFFEMTLHDFTWTETACVGSPPSPRRCHYALVQNNMLYILDYSSDVFCYDFMTWSTFNATHEDSPCDRYSFVAQSYKGKIYIFGGCHNKLRFNDFYQLQITYSNDRLRRLASDFRSLIDNPTGADICFVFHEKRVYAHKSVLSVRSKYFNRMLSTLLLQQDPVEIMMDDSIPYNTFLILIEFLYCGGIHKLRRDIVTNLLIAAEKYELHDLKMLCGEAIGNDISKKTAIEILITSHKYKIDKLKDIAIGIIIKNWNDRDVKNDIEKIDDIDLLLELALRKP